MKRVSRIKLGLAILVLGFLIFGLSLILGKDSARYQKLRDIAGMIGLLMAMGGGFMAASANQENDARD